MRESEEKYHAVKTNKQSEQTARINKGRQTKRKNQKCEQTQELRGKPGLFAKYSEFSDCSAIKEAEQ